MTIFLYLLTPLLAVAAPVAETSLESSLSSTTAAFDGNCLVLKGHVQLDHGLGKMNADEASLQRQEAGKEFPFSLIHLKKDVILNLKNKSQIRCEGANLDFTTLKGLLLPKQGGKVVYTDKIAKKKKGETPLRLMSNRVDIEMFKEGHDGKKTTYDIQTVYATDEVIIDYANAFTLRADHATFKKSSKEDLTKEFKQILTAFPKENGKCELNHEGDQILADLVTFDLGNSLLLLEHPQGTLSSSLLTQVHRGELQFQSHSLLWDHIKNTLTLQGGVQIHEAAIGDLASDDQIQIVHAEQNGKRILKTITSKGKTSLTYLDADKNQTHRLTTFGPLVIDRENLTANVESPLIEGIIPLEKQIHYEEGDIAVFADRALMEYASSGKTLEPTALHLKGRVRLLSSDPASLPRCALADRVNYSPATRTLILAADPGKKVLFWDETQSLSVSAREVHITRDASTQEETIKGVGQVQFAFTSLESDMLKKVFPFYHPQIAHAEEP